MKRGIVEEESCLVCSEEPETIILALRDCPRVKPVWLQLGINATNGVFWGINLHDLMALNGRQNDRSNLARYPWRILFPFAVWIIWKSRNHMVFRNGNHNLCLAVEIANQAKENQHCLASPRMTTRRKVMRIR